MDAPAENHVASTGRSLECDSPPQLPAAAQRPATSPAQPTAPRPDGCPANADSPSARSPDRKRARGNAPGGGASVVEPGGDGPVATTSHSRDDDAALAELTTMNFYDALGAQPGATNAEIRRAFKAAALKHHPDKGGDPRAFRYLSMVRDVLLNKAKREQYDFHGRAPFAEAFSKAPPGGGGETADDAATRLPGQRVLFAPVSDMLEKMAGDEAWAAQRWGQDAGGYRFDVLAAVVLRRVEAAGPPTRAGDRKTRDVYRLGRGAAALGIRESRLVSGRPSEGGGPASLQQEIDASVPRSLAGLSAAQMKSTFRAVVLFGCVEFDLVSSWLFCAKELAAELGFAAPTLERVAVDGLTPEGGPLHAAERRRLAEAAGVSEKIIKAAMQRLVLHWRSGRAGPRARRNLRAKLPERHVATSGGAGGQAAPRKKLFGARAHATGAAESRQDGATGRAPRSRTLRYPRGRQPSTRQARWRRSGGRSEISPTSGSPPR